MISESSKFSWVVGYSGQMKENAYSYHTDHGICYTRCSANNALKVDKSIMVTNHHIWELHSDSEIMHFSLLVKKT